MPDAPDPADVARLLRELVAAVERGELTASSGQDIALLRRIEGAAIAFEALQSLPTTQGGPP